MAIVERFEPAIGPIRPIVSMLDGGLGREVAAGETRQAEYGESNRLFHYFPLILVLTPTLT